MEKLVWKFGILEGKTKFVHFGVIVRSQTNSLNRGPDRKIDYDNTNGIVFVVDSGDKDRVSDARDELLAVLKSDELRDSVLLVYANKQDMPDAMSPAELTDKLGLHELHHREWYIQGACATRGEGLNEGMSILVWSGLTQFCRPVVDDEGIEKTLLVGVCVLFFGGFRTGLCAPFLA